MSRTFMWPIPNLTEIVSGCGSSFALINHSSLRVFFTFSIIIAAQIKSHLVPLLGYPASHPIQPSMIRRFLLVDDRCFSQYFGQHRRPEARSVWLLCFSASFLMQAASSSNGGNTQTLQSTQAHNICCQICRICSHHPLMWRRVGAPHRCTRSRRSDPEIRVVSGGSAGRVGR